MRRALTALLTTMLVAAVYGPAAAGPLDPQFKRQQVYFHCPGDDRVGNVPAVQGTFASWNTSPPTDAFLGSAAGCVSADVFTPGLPGEPVPPAPDDVVDGVWRGTFTGNLNSLTAEVHCICLGSSWMNGSSSVSVRLRIDGQTVLSTATLINAPQENSGATTLYRFSIANIGFIEPNTDVNGDGIGDNPFGTEVHTITLGVAFVDPTATAIGAWDYDATEVPSGIVFNPTGALVAPVLEG